MQAAERSESELSSRLGVIAALIDTGEGDVVALLEEREDIQRRLEAARIAKAARADNEYRANMNAKSAEFRAKLMPVAERIADLIPRLLWDLSKLEELELAALRGGVGNVDFPAETGIPFNFARPLRDAIYQVSSGIEWHFDFIDDESKKNPLPTPKRITLDLRGFRETDANGRPLALPHTYY